MNERNDTFLCFKCTLSLQSANSNQLKFYENINPIIINKAESFLSELDQLSKLEFSENTRCQIDKRMQNYRSKLQLIIDHKLQDSFSLNATFKLVRRMLKKQRAYIKVQKHFETKIERLEQKKSQNKRDEKFDRKQNNIGKINCNCELQKKQKQQIKVPAMDSKIIFDGDTIAQVHTLVDPSLKKFKLLYRMSENNHSDMTDSFYKNCSDRCPCLFLLHLEDDTIIGGFTTKLIRKGRTVTDHGRVVFKISNGSASVEEEESKAQQCDSNIEAKDKQNQDESKDSVQNDNESNEDKNIEDSEIADEGSGEDESNESGIDCMEGGEKSGSNSVQKEKSIRRNQHRTLIVKRLFQDRNSSSFGVSFASNDSLITFSYAFMVEGIRKVVNVGTVFDEPSDIRPKRRRNLKEMEVWLCE